MEAERSNATGGSLPPLTRADIDRLLEVEGRPGKLDGRGLNLKGIDLAQVLNTPPRAGVNRLSAAELTQVRARLAAADIHLQEGPASEQKLAELRATYEPFVSALARRIQVSLPPWFPPADTLDDWQTSAWDEQFPSIHQTLNKVMHPQ